MSNPVFSVCVIPLFTEDWVRNKMVAVWENNNIQVISAIGYGIKCLPWTECNLHECCHGATGGTTWLWEHILLTGYVIIK